MTQVLTKVAVIISSNSRELALRSHDYLSDMLTRSGMVNYPKDTIFDTDQYLAGLEFGMEINFDKVLFGELVQEALGMSLEMCSFKGAKGYPHPKNK